MSGLWIIVNGSAGEGAEMDIVVLLGTGWPLLKTSLLILDRKRPRILLLWLLSSAFWEVLLGLEVEGAC